MVAPIERSGIRGSGTVALRHRSDASGTRIRFHRFSTRHPPLRVQTHAPHPRGVGSAKAKGTETMNKIRMLILVVIASSTGTLLGQQLPPLPFDHILRYDELTTLLRAWANARPNLVEVESIGTTPKGRAIWFLTLTNKKSGPALEKPALVVDGNMHAT